MTGEKTFNFTVARLAALEPPASGETQLNDIGEPGLSIRLRSSGAASFVVRYVVTGAGAGARRFVIGSVASTNLDDARRMARKVITAAREGRDPVAERKKAAKAAISKAVGGVTLGELVTRYAADRRQAGIKTIDETEARLRREFSALLSTPVTEITRAAIVTVLDAVRAGGGSVAARPGSARKIQANIHGVLAYGMNSGVLPMNVMSGYHAPKKSKKQQIIDAQASAGRLLSMSDIAAIWRACDSPKVSLSFGCYVRTLIITAARRGEMSLAKHSWLRAATAEEPAHLTIPGEFTKNGKAHYLPLPALAMGVIAKSPRYSRCALIFPGTRSNKTGAITPHAGFSKMFPKLCREAKAYGLVRHVTLHDLRRGLRSHYTRLGIASEVAEAQLNHSPRDVLERTYNLHDMRAERIAAAERWCAEIESAIALTPAAPDAAPVPSADVVTLHPPQKQSRKRAKPQAVAS